MQLYSWLSANLLVMLVKLLVNLLVKLTKLELGGPWGFGSGEYTWERLVRSPTIMRLLWGYCNITKQPLECDGLQDYCYYEAIARNIARIARSIARNSARIC